MTIREPTAAVVGVAPKGVEGCGPVLPIIDNIIKTRWNGRLFFCSQIPVSAFLGAGGGAAVL